MNIPATIQEAINILKQCRCSILRDPSFGDSEYDWYNDTNQLVASGYVGHGIEVTFYADNNKDYFCFSGKEAIPLMTSYREVKMEYNI